MAPDPPSSQGLTSASLAGEGEAQVMFPSAWETQQCGVAGSGCPQIQGACVLLYPGCKASLISAASHRLCLTDAMQGAEQAL